MKKMIILSFLFLFIPVILYAQDKIEAPIWNIGDKWSFPPNTTVMIINADENSYSIKLSSSGGENIFIHDKSSLNRLYSIEGNRRIQYKGRTKRLLNFPFNVGQTWKDTFLAKSLRGGQESLYSESFKILSWEDVETKAGKFKALKLEYKQETVTYNVAGKAWYWYSPDVKYLVKFQTDKSSFWTGIDDWELTSFELKQ